MYTLKIIIINKEKKIKIKNIYFYKRNYQLVSFKSKKTTYITSA